MAKQREVKHASKFPELAVEAAHRKIQLGYAGLFYQGQVMTPDQVQRLAGEPVYPLPPFTRSGPVENNGPSSSYGY